MYRWVRFWVKLVNPQSKLGLGFLNPSLGWDSSTQAWVGIPQPKLMFLQVGFRLGWTQPAHAETIMISIVILKDKKKSKSKMKFCTYLVFQSLE